MGVEGCTALPRLLLLCSFCIRFCDIVYMGLLRLHWGAVQTLLHLRLACFVPVTVLRKSLRCALFSPAPILSRRLPCHLASYPACTSANTAAASCARAALFLAALPLPPPRPLAFHPPQTTAPPLWSTTCFQLAVTACFWWWTAGAASGVCGGGGVGGGGGEGPGSVCVSVCGLGGRQRPRGLQGKGGCTALLRWRVLQRAGVAALHRGCRAAVVVCKWWGGSLLAVAWRECMVVRCCAMPRRALSLQHSMCLSPPHTSTCSTPVSASIPAGRTTFRRQWRSCSKLKSRAGRAAAAAARRAAHVLLRLLC